jgi:hypothetical protein
MFLRLSLLVKVGMGKFVCGAASAPLQHTEFAMFFSCMNGECARGCPFASPSNWSRNFCADPPCDAEFPEEVAENFVDGQPWLNFVELSGSWN